MIKTFILTSTLLFALNFNPVFSFAEGKPSLSPKCIEEMKQRDESRNKLIMDDIISTFNLEIDESNYREFTSENLDTANLVYGGRVDDPYYNSLDQLFRSSLSTQGTPRLFVRPLTAYILYKEKDNTNVMVLLKLKDHKWEVVEKKREKGKEVKYIQVKCEKDYLKKRNEYEKKNLDY
jgi:hypothetical protein